MADSEAKVGKNLTQYAILMEAEFICAGSGSAGFLYQMQALLSSHDAERDVLMTGEKVPILQSLPEGFLGDLESSQDGTDDRRAKFMVFAPKALRRLTRSR